MAKDETKKDDEGEILDDVLSDEEPVKTAETAETVEEPVKTEDVAPAAEEAKKEEEKKVETEDTKPAPPAKDDVPPPKPARPPTPRHQALKSLQEAFPSVEEKYIQSHLIASGYKLEQAFNALLYLSDPESFNLDEVIPAAEASRAMSETMEQPAPRLPQRRLTQLEEDELLAKQLDDEYRRKAERRARRQQEMRRRRVNEAELDDDEDTDLISNFVDKELPQIKEQLSKNIEETKNKFNTWVSGWKKQYSSAQQELNNRQIKKQMRSEFDDDPEEVDLQKFHGIKLSDDSEEAKPPLPGRRARAESTDLYGTPKHSEEKSKKEEKEKKEKEQEQQKKKAEDDDDFLLSD